jgi:hypothetical protein
MISRNPCLARRTRTRPRQLALVVVLLAALGCAAPARLEVPAELPLVTQDQFFEIRWALQRGPSATRAAGWVRPSLDSEFQLTLGVFGVDAGGRIASRGTAHLRSRFDRGPVPFAVEITPTGREARHEVRVLEYYLTGLRAS